MPKLKTKSGAKKRFSRTASGKIKAAFGFKRHNLRKRSKKMKRGARGTFVMQPGDAEHIKGFMPYLRG